MVELAKLHNIYRNDISDSGKEVVQISYGRASEILSKSFWQHKKGEGNVSEGKELMQASTKLAF